jgi:hypothetical protein
MKKEKCFDMGVIQAFTDGELSSDLQEKVIGHIALCDTCAVLLAETEEESAFAFSVLDEELNVLVPTERLRTKVLESIKESQEKVSWWQKVTESLGLAGGFSFKSPSLVAFASVVLFVSALAIGVNFYQPMPNSVEVVGIDKTINISDVSFPAPAPQSDDSAPEDDVDVPTPTFQNPPSQSGGFEVVNAGGIKKKKRSNVKISQSENSISAQNAVVREPVAPPPSPNLSGEDSYLQTIATLSQTVDMNKDLTLRPKERMAFERDMAVVNDAIKKMKEEVRKNPKNQAAREVLRSSYKNKIDLLNSVAEKNELMASIQ